MKSLSTLVAAAALVAGSILPAQAGISFDFSTSGVVFPTDPTNCPDAFSGCELTALAAPPFGLAQATTGNIAPLPGPWNFAASFKIVEWLPSGDARTTGGFMFDDPSLDNDLWGTLDGVLNVTTFINAMTYTVTGGSGLFASVTGSGSSLIQIIPPQGQFDPFTFAESGSIHVPEPHALALALLGLAGVGALRQRASRR